jgi:hypothetical protein
MRQIEAAELMTTAGNYTASYAQALLAATRQSDLVKSATNGIVAKPSFPNVRFDLMEHFSCSENKDAQIEQLSDALTQIRDQTPRIVFDHIENAAIVEGYNRDDSIWISRLIVIEGVVTCYRIRSGWRCSAASVRALSSSL